MDGVVRLELDLANDSTSPWSAENRVHLRWQRSDGRAAAEDVRLLGQAVATGATVRLTLVTLAPAEVGDFQLIPELETRTSRLAIGDPLPFHLSGFIFRGHGNGHGLGMSQWGARGRGAAGDDYRKILSAYYRGAAIDTRDTSGPVRIALTHRPIDLARQWARLFGPFPMVAGPVTVEGAALPVGPGDTLGFAADSQGRPVAFVQTATGARPGGPVVIGGKLTIRAGSPAGIRTNLQEALDGDFRSGSELRRYPGVLEIIPKGAATVLPVNVLPMEDYLRGVVPAEMPPSWGPEALKAQAVAARTYALRKVLLGGRGDFDLEGNEFDQAYSGLSQQRPASTEAVTATRGQVLTFDGRLIEALFMASGGGHTENSEFGFIRWDHGLKPAVNLPYLRGIPDPLDRAPDWQIGPFSPAAAATVLRDNDEDLGDRLLGIDVLQRGPSGRILGARLRGSGQTEEISGPFLRSLFGLPDTLVEIVGGS